MVQAMRLASILMAHLSDEEAYTNTIKHLSGDPENPFVIFDDVKELYAKRAEELKKIVAERKAAEAEWRKANPEKSAQMDEWFSGKAPKVDWSKIEQKAGSATPCSICCLFGCFGRTGS